MIIVMHKKGMRLVGKDVTIGPSDVLTSLAKTIAWRAWKDAAKIYSGKISDEHVERLFEVWWKRNGFHEVSPDAELDPEKVLAAKAKRRTKKEAVG